MGDGKLAKKAEAQKMERKSRRGRLLLQWEDCVKRDMDRVEEERRTTDRRNWIFLINKVVRVKRGKRR